MRRTDYDDEYYGPEIRSRDSLCDSDCRGANRCGGHVICERCRRVVCECTTDERGLCEDCACEEVENGDD